MTRGLALTLAQGVDGGGGDAAALAVLLAVLAVPLVVGLVMLAGMWKVFTKAGRPGWGVLVPIYNMYLLCRIAGRPGWWFLLLLIPVVNVVIGLVLSLDLARVFGRGAGFGIGLFLLPFVFYPLLGFGSSRHHLAAADGEDEIEEGIVKTPRAASAGAGAAAVTGRPSLGTEVGDVLQSMLPWVTSLLFHLGVIVLAFFAVWSYLTIQEEDEPIIPIARLSEDAGGQLSQSRDVDLQATQDRREIRSESVAEDDALDSLEMNTDDTLELVGMSGGEGGKIAPFGTTAGSSGEVAAKFYGAGGNATKLIYVVDASGSLIDTLPFVMRELKRSMRELSERQRFTVIFFQDGTAVEAPPRGWKEATPKMKERVSDWITLDTGNIVPRGSTNPIAAMRLAMRYRPQLVFILSDNITGRGRYEVDREELLGMLDSANRDRQIKINTIQFLYPDPLGTLEDIAEEHGGVHRFITESDLGLME